jgi:hypothetical protein
VRPPCDRARVCTEPRPRLKRRELPLHPGSLGAIKRTEIATLQLDSGGYADVWMYPYGEEAYSDAPVPGE